MSYDENSFLQGVAVGMNLKKSSCSKIKISEEAGGEYVRPYRIPADGEGTQETASIMSENLHGDADNQHHLLHKQRDRTGGVR